MLAFSLWKCAKVAKMCNYDFAKSTDDVRIDSAEVQLPSFYSKMSILIDNEFMFYLPKIESESGTEFEFVQGSINTRLHLDTIIATAATCARSNGIDIVGSHLRKLFHDDFASFLSKAFRQIVGNIRVFKQLWCPTEISVSPSRIYSGSQMSGTVQDATMKICDIHETAIFGRFLEIVSPTHNYGARCSTWLVYRRERPYLFRTKTTE